MLDVIPDPATARRKLRKHEQGAIVCGLIRHGETDEILAWVLGTGWVRGYPGTFAPCEFGGLREQTAWLRRMRKLTDWDLLLTETHASRRTWQGWEQGRTVPPEIILQLAQIMESTSPRQLRPRVASTTPKPTIEPQSPVTNDHP